MKRIIPSLLALCIVALSCSTPDKAPRHSLTPLQGIGLPMVDTTLAFFDWYKANMNRLAQIHMVNQVEGTPYSVDKAGCEQFLDELRKSGLVTEGYLSGHRADFQRYQQQFEAEPQTEGPPMGFDMDLVMMSQEPDVDLDSLPHARILESSMHNDSAASVNVLLYYEFEVALLKDTVGWKVERIRFVKDE